MDIIQAKDYTEMSKLAADLLVKHINNTKSPILGLATGSTPIGLYKELVKRYKQSEISFKHVTTFNLDEYVGISRSNPNSYHYFMNDNLWKHIDIDLANVNIPDGMADNLEKECIEYEERIANQPIDIQILGIGLNGHIGFNEPGTSFDSRTHIVELDESTREANSRFFDSLDEVPKQAITMGIETIMKAKKVILLVSGKAKATTLAKLISNEEVTPDFPASVLRKHKDVTIIADEEAREKIKL